MFTQKSLNKYCGPKMLGPNVNDSCGKALQKIRDNLLSAFTSTWFNTVTPGVVMNNYPTMKDYIKYLTSDMQYQIKNYDKYGSCSIEDSWAKILEKRKCCLLPNYFIPPEEKRFVAVKQTKLEYIKDQLRNVDGILMEVYLGWYVNKYLVCPECDVKGQISLAGASGCNHSVAFQDAVCLDCKTKGVDTIYEFKVRNVFDFSKKTNCYGGNYIAIETMLAHKKNVYMVVMERQSGNVYISKVKNASPRINERFLYTIQENLSWGNPSSTVYFNQPTLIPARARPVYEELSKDKINSIVKEVLLNLLV